MAPVSPAPRVKPLLRGVSHQIAAFVALPAAATLVLGASGGSALAAALTYGASVVTLFSVSALYHRPTWSKRGYQIMWRLDHAAIFVLIAGTYTPLCLLMGPGTGTRLLVAVWSGAGVGIVLSMLWPTAPKKLMAGLYVALGWFAGAALPSIRGAIGDGALALLLVGGLLYTVGAVIYAKRRPDPFPTVFGFHEIFHLAVIAAAVCHFVVVGDAIARLNGHGAVAPPASASAAPHGATVPRAAAVLPAEPLPWRGTRLADR